MTAPAPVVAPTVDTLQADLAKVKADYAIVQADLAKIDAKATSWLAANAHAFVTGALVLAVLFILHKIL